jgi:hypothetical protein
LKPSDEGTHPVQNTPLWSENYLSQIYAPEAKIGFWFHFGRASFDPTLWNEVFVAYLPGDKYLVSGSYSYGDGPTGPTGNQLHYRCNNPFEQWTKSFYGAANLVTGEQLRAGPHVTGTHILVDAELTWDSLGPAFDLGPLSSNETWSKAHYEQHGRVRGYITYDGKRVELIGSGIRDHSWGPRDLSRFNYHVWMSGQFPDGRTFMVFHIVDDKGHSGTHALLGDANGVRAATLESNPPLITDASQIMNGYDMVFTTASGERAEISATIIQAPPISFGGASELLFGCHRPAGGTHWLYESQTRFEWDGQVGYGLTDRTVNMKNR